MIWFKLPDDNDTIYKIKNNEIISYDVTSKRSTCFPINGEWYTTEILIKSLKGEPLSKIDLLLYGLKNE